MRRFILFPIMVLSTICYGMKFNLEEIAFLADFGLSKEERLFNAIDNSEFGRAQDFIKFSKVGVNIQNSAGFTPLHSALYKEDCPLSFIQFLVWNNADVTLANVKGDTPLHRAIYSYVLSDPENRKHFFEIIKILGAYGANENVTNQKGETPLSICKHWKLTSIANLIQSKDKHALANRLRSNSKNN